MSDTSEAHSEPNGTSRPLTIQAIADQLGIHKSTVSLALSGKGRISPATRERILALVREHGYAPDPFAQRLASRTRHETVYICSGTLDPGLGTEKVALLQSRLTSLGLDVPISTPARISEGDKHSLESQIEHFRNLRRLRPRAIVCSVFRFHEDALEELKHYQHDGGIVVSYDLPISLDCDQVIFDREDNAYQGARYLLERGHHYLGFGMSRHSPAVSSNASTTHNQKLAGYQRALREWSVSQTPWMVENASYRAGGAALAAEFLKLKHRPTGLCFVNDYVALEFMAEVLRSGHRVPDDVSVIGHENQRILRFAPVRLTSISHPVEAIVDAVVHRIMERLAGNDEPPQTVLVQGHFIPGDSVTNGPYLTHPKNEDHAGQLPLSMDHRVHLEQLLRQSGGSTRIRQRARALLELNRGGSPREIARRLGISYSAVISWRDAYQQIGLEVLQDKPRSGRPVVINATQRAQITTLARTPAPDGHGQWSLRLLAEKAVELKLVEHISHNHVAKILREAGDEGIPDG